MGKKFVDPSVAGIARDWIPVTPNDSTDNLTAKPDDVVIGIHIGATAGNVVVTIDGTDRTLPLSANTTYHMTGATRVKATSTTATPIFSLVI